MESNKRSDKNKNIEFWKRSILNAFFKSIAASIILFFMDSLWFTIGPMAYYIILGIVLFSISMIVDLIYLTIKKKKEKI